MRLRKGRECPWQAPLLLGLCESLLVSFFLSLSFFRMSIPRRTKLFSNNSYKTLIFHGFPRLRIGHLILHSFLKFQERIELKGSNSLTGYTVWMNISGWVSIQYSLGKISDDLKVFKLFRLIMKSQAEEITKWFMSMSFSPDVCTSRINLFICLLYLIYTGQARTIWESHIQTNLMPLQIHSQVHNGASYSCYMSSVSSSPKLSPLTLFSHFPFPPLLSKGQSIFHPFPLYTHTHTRICVPLSIQGYVLGLVHLYPSSTSNWQLFLFHSFGLFLSPKFSLQNIKFLSIFHF